MAVPSPTTGRRSTPTPSCWSWGCPTSGRVSPRASRSPAAAAAPPWPRCPGPVRRPTAGSPRPSVVVVLLFAGPILAHFPMAALGGLVVFAAFKIVDIAEFRWLWNFRRSEFWLGHRHGRRRAHPQPAGRHRVRDRAVGRGRAGTGRAAARGGPGPGPRPGGHARHRRVPGRHAGRGPAGVPLRLAAVLRQRRGLPPARPRRRAGAAGRGPGGPHGPAELRGQRRCGLHRGGGPRVAGARAAAPRDLGGPGAGARGAGRAARSGPGSWT